MRYFIRLAYRGAPFHGWQVQPGVVTVQSTLEGALSTLAGRHIDVTGAGRTDAGVNARKMVAHCDLPDDLDVDDRFVRSVNSICGRDIAVEAIWPVAPDAHARFDALERTYRYFVHTRKDPFAGPLSWQAPPSLDFDAMNRAAHVLVGVHDFTSFSKLHTDVKTNICDLRHARWYAEDDSHWYFEITADRFLRNMVRAVVGTLVDVGRHKLDTDGVRRILEARDRCAAGTSMPGEALFLWDVKYPADAPLTSPRRAAWMSLLSALVEDESDLRLPDHLDSEADELII